MERTQVTGIETEIERDAAARGNGIGIGMIKMIKMMTENHERGERARAMMVEIGRRSEDDGLFAHLLSFRYICTMPGLLSRASKIVAPCLAIVDRLAPIYHRNLVSTIA
jgi:hypothetical protein